MWLPSTSTTVSGPATPERYTTMPGSNRVPPVPVPPKHPATTQVSVVVGRLPDPVGWTVTLMPAVATTTPGTATWTDRGVFTAFGIGPAETVPPARICCNTILASTPQPGNGSANGQAASTKSTIVHVVEPAPPTSMRWPSVKPLSIHDRPSRRVTVPVPAPVLTVSISNVSSRRVLPPPWTTVRPPCGPGQNTWRVE